MLQPPPTFEDLNERVKDYLVKPENLSIHKWTKSQNHWHRNINIDSILEDDIDLLEPEFTLVVGHIK